MGNDHSFAQQSFGFFFVQTDRPYYYPGNSVHCKVYLRLDRPTEFKNLQVRLKCKEKIGFRKRKIQEGHEGEPDIVEWEKVKEDRKHIDLRTVI